MADQNFAELDCRSTLPSVHDRIAAMSEQYQLVEHIVGNPQAGISRRYSEEWTMAKAYAEGEIQRCSDHARTFLWRGRNSFAPETVNGGWAKAMGDLANSLILFGMYMLPGIVLGYSH
jgi:hypothetical protein